MLLDNRLNSDHPGAGRINDLETRILELFLGIGGHTVGSDDDRSRPFGRDLI